MCFVFCWFLLFQYYKFDNSGLPGWESSISLAVKIQGYFLVRDMLAAESTLPVPLRAFGKDAVSTPLVQAPGSFRSSSTFQVAFPHFFFFFCVSSCHLYAAPLRFGPKSNASGIGLYLHQASCLRIFTDELKLSQ